jgi:non-ribosomal peptide synthetase component E (peptide arylation enzyme)
MNLNNLDRFLDTVQWPEERKRRMREATFNAPYPLKYVLMDNVPIALIFEMAFLESEEHLSVLDLEELGQTKQGGR